MRPGALVLSRPAGTIAGMRTDERQPLDERDDPPPPSPAEIRRLCEEIQAGWSDEERARRAGRVRVQVLVWAISQEMTRPGPRRHGRS